MPSERARLEQAARLLGSNLSTFVMESALERADQVISERATTVVPADFFDSLLNSLDKPDRAPKLAKAAQSRKRDAKRRAS